MIARTILVTGAMGQVGKRVAQLLLDRGRTVIALDLKNPTTEAVTAWFNPGAGTLVPAYADLLDSDAVAALLNEHEPQAILHLAAVVAPPAYLRPGLARRVNVDGTANLVAAAQQLPTPPLFVEASSASVYGSRNPHTHHDRLTAATPVNPVDCYGEDKVLAERLVAASGLPHATFRLGGIISPDLLQAGGPEYRVMMRAFPSDNRIHAVDSRDVALAFANAADRAEAIDGKVLLIGGNESYVLVQHELSDDLMESMGVGRLGPNANLPGDPADENGWGLTDWFDTTEAQQLLDFQARNWQDTRDWVAEAFAKQARFIRPVAPVVRLIMRLQSAILRRLDKRGRYADPWRLISAKFGPEVLAATHRPS